MLNAICLEAIPTAPKRFGNVNFREPACTLSELPKLLKTPSNLFLGLQIANSQHDKQAC